MFGFLVALVVNPRLAGERLEIMLKQYPSLVKNCVPKLTQSLQVVAPTEEAAFGACNILKSRSLLRHLMQVGWLVGWLCFQ
jgi:hypothetical protein